MAGVAVLLIAGAWVYMTFGTATIAVTSEPSGAIVRVDGRQRGLTPVDRLELDVGSHRLEVQHSHYQPLVEGLSLSRGDHLVRHVQFQAGMGTLNLMSNPRGAWVEIDGERIAGTTPITVEVSSGEHAIAMGQQERRIVEEQHTVKHGETLEVNFNLNIDPHGSVTITTSPRNAKVEFIGEDIDYKPNMRLPIGEYAVRVSRPGYVTQEFRYQVRYGNNLHHVELRRDFGNLIVNVTPAGADVSVAYQDGGRRQRDAYTSNMRVPVGEIEVRARAIGHRTAFRTLRLGNQGATINITLQTMSVEPGRVFSDALKSGGTGPELVVIPAGSFTMGDDAGPPSERPAHRVTLTQPFAVSRYEITIGDYLRYLQARNRSLSDRLNAANTNHAVTYVSFDDAAEYAGWLSEQTGEKYRLLSEAEWEYVARAGSNTHYFWGDDENRLCEFANVADRTARERFREWDTLSCEDNLVRPGPVGTYQPNPFGVFDIYGNVSEWVLDCGMPGYAGSAGDGAPRNEGYGCPTHGFRGGSWDSTAIEARSSYRNTAASANDDRGIRLLRVL